MASALAACVSLEQSAPPVEMLAGGGNHAALNTGRDIYITRCAKCHTVEPVTKYSLKEWGEILPDMAERSHLSAADAQSVTAYVHEVLASGTVAGR